jgi:hypothetical protein
MATGSICTAVNKYARHGSFRWLIILTRYFLLGNQEPFLSLNEFSRIVRDFSEDEAFYYPEADNYISNELGYANAVDELKKLPVRGDAFIGVGPEQNFTYIANLQPRIAFILDIRRQAVIQHLMYQAIFHIAQDRAAFLKLIGYDRQSFGNKVICF